MSAVDVLAVLDRQLRNRAERAGRYSKNAAKAAAKSGEPQITADRMAAYENLLLSELREARAAVAELIEASREFSKLYGCLWDVAEPEGSGFLSPELVVKYDNAHERLDAALARVTGAQS